MDALWGLLVGIGKLLALELIFFWPGWLVLKLVTLGRYPRLLGPGRNVNDYTDVQLVAYIGLCAVLAILVLIVT